MQLLYKNSCILKKEIIDFRGLRDARLSKAKKKVLKKPLK